MLKKLRRARADLTTMNVLLPAAERIAHDDGVEQPAAEHLVLAALDLDDGIARRALESSGVDGAALRRAVSEQHDEAVRAVGVIADDNAIAATLPAARAATGLYRSQGSLQTAFQRAVDLARDDGRPLMSGHVLLAALASEHGTVARSLDHLGVDRDALRERTHQLLGR